MTDEKNAAAPKTQTFGKQSTNTNYKHSSIFFISSSLFDNKRLKRRRCQWVMTRKASAKRKKWTERRKKRLKTLKADVTIDLLSEDEKEEEHKDQAKNRPPFIHFPAQTTMQISQVPNITLIPVQPMYAAPKRVKNKRKTHPQKRPPVPNCTESIVLTDDDDEITEPSAKPSSAQPPTAFFTQVDEEVSVSLVPRSKPSGTCAANNATNASTLFPMLPDETTVHTVIANRIYELSLTKLREGLATCGIPEFADYQPQVSAKTRRKCNFAPPQVEPPPAPISLKLSSDLSISLISDDEQDEPNQLGLEHANALLLGQRSPSLKIRTMWEAPAPAPCQQDSLLEPLQQQPYVVNVPGQEAERRIEKPRKRKLG